MVLLAFAVACGRRMGDNLGARSVCQPRRCLAPSPFVRPSAVCLIKVQRRIESIGLMSTCSFTHVPEGSCGVCVKR